MAKLKTPLRWLMSALLVLIGILHFVAPTGFAAIVPRYLPAPVLLVYLSGACEILGGVGLQVPRARRLAAWGLIALFVAVFPANINMAVNHIAPEGLALPTWALWGRLPFQAVLIAWAWWVARPESDAG